MNPTANHTQQNQSNQHNKFNQLISFLNQRSSLEDLLGLGHSKLISNSFAMNTSALLNSNNLKIPECTNNQEQLFNYSKWIQWFSTKNFSNLQYSYTPQKEKNTQRQNEEVQRCTNRLCKFKFDKLTKVKSSLKIFDEYHNFCERCTKYYNNGNYCDFCEQVYGNSSEEYRDEKTWIQCDECKKWNHIECEAEQRNKAIFSQKQLAYYCLHCTAQAIKEKKRVEKTASPQTQKSQDSDPYIYEYKQKNDDLQRPMESKREKEKNINLTVTNKDNKISLTIRLNLLDEEAKRDIDNMIVQTTKKIKKNPIQLSPKKKSASSLEDKVAVNIGKQNRRSRRHQKINYRNMVGDL